MYDFANILFAGPCNRLCPWCIGKQMPDRVNVDNLGVFPPRGLDAFVDAVNEHAVAQVVFTGTVTDPQLYRHEAELIATLRRRLHAGARLSLHTNGVLALKKVDVFNRYDRACVSFPSFRPETYEKMMGSRRVPDLAGILAAATIPVKVSAVLDEPNEGDVEVFLAACHRIGVRRLVFRRLYGETGLSADTPVSRADADPRLVVVRMFKGNPVYDFQGMEVTYWDFDATADMRSLNLFADGTLGTSYLLAKTPQLRV